VPGSEIVVTREALRSNQSNYYLDGKKKTFKEVGALLRHKGIDLDHNRFLILQGEVEQIAMMKPKGQTEHDEGLLEYLEDIIGSDRFKEDIAAAEVKVEQLNETRNEKLNRVKVHAAAAAPTPALCDKSQCRLTEAMMLVMVCRPPSA